ncbi:sigma-70 family RNA polymerase sigma factor [Microbacterium aquimaris]|uniref:RNA polymerase sigma factor n=1 Tax=Microbacterium aquimaris TaxID=459816 RepID=UPI002AD1F28A|nr:sigma-70 family RNA polymerase sigma factor [Microbacterium aquimaris]MDZ8275793.1 sigma-70 family RNA polymerase sigma factor [Microbacterium aquimaris]
MNTAPASTDAALVARAASGSEHAFRALYRSYATPLYRIAYALLGDAADAEDVLQETFLVAWRKLPTLRLAGESLLPWLVTICRLQSANRMRTQRRDREHRSDLTDAVPARTDVEQQVIGADLARRIGDEVEGLGDLDRGIFLLCAVDGLDYAAAAARLGVTHGVVRNRLSRIRSRLRTTVKENSP